MTQEIKEKEGYLTKQEKDFLLSEEIFGSYVTSNKTLINWLNANGLPLTFQGLLEYYKECEITGKRARTMNRIRAQIRRITRELVAQRPKDWTLLRQYELDQAFRHIKGAKIHTTSVHRDRYLTRDELTTLVDTAKYRFSLLLRFMIHTGCRVSELLAVRAPDFEVGRREIRVRLMGKASKERWVPIDKALYQEIWREYRPYSYVFTQDRFRPYNRSWIYRKIRSHGLKAIGRHVTPHMLRHSLAMLLLEEGHDAHAIAEHLGHHDPALTMAMYIHTEIELEDLPVFPEPTPTIEHRRVRKEIWQDSYRGIDGESGNHGGGA